MSFEDDIRPLFRDGDRTAMRYAFDLWSHADVREHADAILERIEEGTMPCDDPWPDDQVEIFRAWIEEGSPA
jgi:hypothetical protein